MRLTIRRKGSLFGRSSLVDALAESQAREKQLLRRALKAEADAALARSSSKEWSDRYRSLRNSSGSYV
jgi:hypothetical protein